MTGFESEISAYRQRLNAAGLGRFSDLLVRLARPSVRLIPDSANPVDLVHAMSAAAYESAFHALYTLTGEEDLTEVANSGALDMLHEDLLSADPTGLEGSDLFA